MDLLSEIKGNIFLKLLRLTLDDIEDDHFCLVRSTKPNIVFSILGYNRKYDHVNNIDYYLKLLRMKPIGTNPNILSYKGNSIFHLLVKTIIQKKYLTQKDEEYQHLQSKLSLLCKYGIDINLKGYNGNTIAHESISMLINSLPHNHFHCFTIDFLLDLGMNISKTKNNDEQTAYQIGYDIVVNKRRNGIYNKIELSSAVLLLSDFRLKECHIVNVMKAVDDFTIANKKYQLSRKK